MHRLWTLLPPNGRPWAHRAILAAASLFPGRMNLMARIFFGRLLAETTTMADTYPAWISFYEHTGPRARRAAKAYLDKLDDLPLLSVLLPVHEPSPDYLLAAIESVRVQFYPRWELCIADYSSANPRIATLLDKAGSREPRIKLIRRAVAGETVSAANAAFSLAGGLFCASMDDDARLSPRALYDIAQAIRANPAVDILYSDEDRIDESGRRIAPYFKPDWNPELMFGQNLIGHLAAYRRDLVRQAGGFGDDPQAFQAYDLALRLVAATTGDRIVHIPNVLYHGRRVNADRCVPSLGECGRYPIPRPEPLVSVVIPTRDHAAMLKRTMDGLLGRTDYPALDVLIVDNGSSEPNALVLLENLALDGRVTVLRRPGPFNYSALNNDAIRHAKGELVLLLNNDIDVIDAGWLREMVAQAIRPGIGAVGAKLLFPDGTIQHGGITVGMFGTADHQYLNAPREDPGYFGHLRRPRNITAVTAACLLVRRQAYWEVDGLNEADLPVEFNDVDFCLKLAEKGYRNLWTSHAELYHLEAGSRGYAHSADKAARLRRGAAYMRERWGHMLDHDPNWNRNLSLYSNGVALAFPPRPGR
jgi:GT2 family glycosyltransferase